MVIERFKNRDMTAIHHHLRDREDMPPEGLRDVSSGAKPSFGPRFQLTESDRLRLFQAGVPGWRSAEAGAKAGRRQC